MINHYGKVIIKPIAFPEPFPERLGLCVVFLVQTRIVHEIYKNVIGYSVSPDSLGRNFMLRQVYKDCLTVNIGTRDPSLGIQRS